MKNKGNIQKTQEKELISSKEFVEAWQSHINDFNRLRFYLSAENQGELNSTLANLNHLVLIAEQMLRVQRGGRK